MSPASSSVSAMIQTARGQDMSALDELLAAYRNYLRVVAELCLASSATAKVDPSDVVQETLLKAHQRFGQFQGHTESELTAWLRRILSRVVVDVVRQFKTEARDVMREQSLERSLEGSAQVLNRLLPVSSSSPSQRAERREAGVILADALAQLPAAYRQVITLRGLHELEWKECAVEMNRTVGAVRMLWVRALSELRDHLEGIL